MHSSIMGYSPRTGSVLKNADGTCLALDSLLASYFLTPCDLPFPIEVR
jgi:hypothetical protein